MDTSVGFVAPTVNLTREVFMVLVGRQFYYLFFYKSKLKNLKEEVDKLDEKIGALKLLVDEEERNSKIIGPDVKGWLERADKCSKEASKILGDETKANKMCLNGWCPNLKLRYSLGKKATKKEKEVAKLHNQQNFIKVAYTKPPPGIESTPIEGIKGLESRSLIMNDVMVISFQVLKNVTNNFSEENLLGRGGFGAVYKGNLHDGTKVAIKRMESGIVTENGLDEFKSEIDVLTKVRHRHLVGLLGYCLDGNERLLVYEYMSQGTLSRFLFNWKEEGLKPLEWSKRLIIALDVAKGVEYLHGLAHQSFIHRDLKPANILLGDNMRAKVADFGLVRLAPDGKSSILTRLAGTFGYLAPEYAGTGRVTVKIDLFSFGVILLQFITGRKAIFEVEPQQDEYIDLVTWFHGIRIHKNSFQKAIDSTIELDEETLSSINIVAELACHCCAKEPSQRPNMAHVVNVLSSLVNFWKPSNSYCEEGFGSSGEVKSTHHSHIYQNEWPQLCHDTKNSSPKFSGSLQANGLKVPPSITI